ncbi:MAG: class I SAM-dependent methyltransferase [Candidatus Omnitrophica bacterium]|nr:class I SAM-dependent methyltransferase [Candidatus Omnitrophota bacterium]
MFEDRLHCYFCGMEGVPSKDVSNFSFVVEMKGMFDFLNRTFSLYQCKKCSMGLTFPSVKEHYISLLYDKPEARDVINDDVFVSQVRQFFFRREAQWWISWLGSDKAIEKGAEARLRHVLDFGTGSGLNAIALENVLNDNWRVWACDFSSETPLALSKNPQITYLSHKALEKCGQKFDCIHLRHILEHTPNPRAFLIRMWDLLSAGGTLFIEVPSLYPALHHFTMRYFQELFQSNLPYHYCFFSSESLRDLLLETGFSFKIQSIDIPIMGRLLQARTGHLFAGKRYFPLFILGIILYPLQWLYVRLTGVQPLIRILAWKKDKETIPGIE